MVVAIALAACGGSKSYKVDDSRLVRLSPEARQNLLDQEREVRVAEINLDAARVAAKEAKDFQSIVGNERNAANQQLQAAQKAKKLGEGSRDGRMTENATDDEAAGQARLKAAEAKVAYAKQLVAYRAEVVEQREAELAAARADLETRKVVQLSSAGQAEGLDQSGFESSARAARQRAEKARARAVEKRGTVEARRGEWQSARGNSSSGIDDAPPPPTALD